ncbi:MAG: Maf family protein [Pseudomonadota bacterium]
MSLPLVLASTSVYRRALLERLGVAFDIVRPEVDETPLPGETPFDLARRLAVAKAWAGARARPGLWTIGSDQVADLDGQPINKPEAHEPAVAQLLSMSGREVVFHTAVSLARYEAGVAPADAIVEVVPTRVRYRPLDRVTVERYLAREPAYDCAGSSRIEALGVTLVESVQSEDPTALIGLPLIRLCARLRAVGYRLP